MNALVNRVAIVTGASSGIGRATASLLAREGAKVVVAARRQQELDELVDDITRAGGTAIALAGDVKDEAVAHAFVEVRRPESNHDDGEHPRSTASSKRAMRSTP